MDFTYFVTALSIVGTIANIHKKQWCFLIWLVTNTFWMFYDWSIGAKGQALLMFVYVILAAWGLWQWRNEN